MQHNPSSATQKADTASPRAGFSIFVLAVAAFLIVTNEYIILGILPALAQDLDISISAAGLFVTLFAFTVMLFGPPLTVALSHVRRKTLFVAIMVIFAFSNALAAISPNVWILAVARFVPALFLPVFWGTASETASQLVGGKSSGRAVALIYLGISAALVFGIPLGTLSSAAVGWRGMFWGLAALSLAMAVVMAIVLPTMPVSTTAKGASQTHIFKDRNFLANVLLSVLLFTAMFTAYTYLADLLERVANISAEYVGWWLMGFGAVGLFGNWLGGRFVDRSPLGASMIFAAILAVAMLAFVPMSGSNVGLTVSLVAWGIAYTALFPICQVRVMNVGASAPALAGTINVSAANAGTGLGAIIGGISIDQLGLGSVGMVATVIAVIAIALAAVMQIQTSKLAPAE